MTKTFREALLSAIEAQGISLRQVALGSGVSYEQLKKVSQRPTATTNVDDARLVANFFGVTIDEFLGDQTASIRSDVAKLYSQLSESEIRMLRRLAAAQDVDLPKD